MGDGLTVDNRDIRRKGRLRYRLVEAREDYLGKCMCFLLVDVGLF